MNAMAASDVNRSHMGAAGSVWFLLLGAILFLCGLFALLAPFASTMAFSVILGAAALVAGIAQVVHAFGVKTWRGFFLDLILGVLYAICGGLLLFNPAAGAIVLTMVLTFFLLAIGLGEIVLAFWIRPEKGWIWLALSGVIALIGGIWLFLRLPIAGLFVPGIVLGVSLIMEGTAFGVIGLTRGRSVEADKNRTEEPPAAAEA